MEENDNIYFTICCDESFYHFSTSKQNGILRKYKELVIGEDYDNPIFSLNIFDYPIWKEFNKIKKNLDIAISNYNIANDLDKLD